MSIQETKLKAIADAIREKEGSSEPILASDFPARILALETGGVPEGVYAITLSASDGAGGTVSGGGLAAGGMTVTVKAAVADGYDFTGWQENGQTVSTDVEYTFTVVGDRTLTAMFEEEAFGLDWKTSSLTGSDSWCDICYGNGTFVAIASAYDYYTPVYSTDDVTWTKATYTAVNKNFGGVAYGNGRFLEVGQGYYRYSSNGKTWTNNSGAANVAQEGITYGNGVFAWIATASAYAYYMTFNGSSFGSSTLITLPFRYKTRFAYGNGRFVTLGRGETNTAANNTGAYWTYGGSVVQITLPVAAVWSDLIYGGDKFVAIASGSDDALYSTDGVTWSATKLPVSDSWVSVAYGGGMYVAIAANSNKVVYSKDGISWNLADSALPSASNWSKICYGGDKFVAIAKSSATAAYAIA